MKKQSVLSASIFVLLCGSHLNVPVAARAAESWPEFRGPNCSGTAADAHPPLNIGPTNGVQWSVEVPWSPSSPCVWGDRIFLTTFADGQLQTRAYARRDGRLLWNNGI